VNLIIYEILVGYALGIRVKRICSEETNYNNRREELIKRRYSKGTIENQLKKVDMLKRENLPQYNTKKTYVYRYLCNKGRS
jgi:uncharacterized membrane protein